MHIKMLTLVLEDRLLIPLLVLSYCPQLLHIILRQSSNGISPASTLGRTTSVSVFLAYLILNAAGPLGDLDCLRDDGRYHEQRWIVRNDRWCASGCLVGVMVVGAWLACESTNCIVVMLAAPKATVEKRLVVSTAFTVAFWPILAGIITTREAPIGGVLHDTAMFVVMIGLFSATMALAVLQYQVQRQTLEKTQEACRLSRVALILQTLVLITVAFALAWRQLEVIEMSHMIRGLYSGNIILPWLVVSTAILHVAAQPMSIVLSNITLLGAIWGTQKGDKSDYRVMVDGAFSVSRIVSVELKAFWEEKEWKKCHDAYDEEERFLGQADRLDEINRRLDAM